MRGGESTSPPGAGPPSRSTTPLSNLTEDGEPDRRAFDDDDDRHPQHAPPPAVEQPILCPRGLAAIPLLCAAASEPRDAYLERLRATHPNDGWWAKQEPLCLEPSNPLSLPERLVIFAAALIEKASLLAGEYMGEERMLSSVSPRILQSILWPVHNILLCCWIAMVLALTFLGSAWGAAQTLLFGARRTHSPLLELFRGEVHPMARAVETLTEEHQVLGVRCVGLALMPLMILCDAAVSLAGRAGIYAGGVALVAMGACTWWYWLCVLPWLGCCGLWLAAMSGGCHGVIEASRLIDERETERAEPDSRSTNAGRSAPSHIESF